MKTRSLLIGMILIVGVLLAGFGLDLARAQGEQVGRPEGTVMLPGRLFPMGVPDTVQASLFEYPEMNWERVTEYGFGHPDGFVGAITSLEVFNDALFAGPGSMPTGTAVYRSEDGLSWVQVSDMNFGQPIPEPDLECGLYWWYIWDMVVFDGQLYATAGLCCIDANWSYWGGMIFRSSDGYTWEPVVTDGFGYSGTQSVHILSVFDNMIYAGTADLTNGAHIYRSDTGDAGDWEDVTPSNLGMPAHYYTNDFQVYHDMLFVTTNVITVTGEAQVWSTEDGVNWTSGPMDMFACEPDCSGSNLAVFNDTLYMGIYNVITGGELWSTDNGLTWTMNAKVDDPSWMGMDPLEVYDGYLYIVLNDINWSPGGLLRTADGVTFEIASKPGFDLESGAAAFANGAAIFQDHFYLGKFNWDIGGSIWRDAPFYNWMPWASK